MNKLLITLLALLLAFGSSCVFTDDVDTPDAVIVDSPDPPANNTTIIDNDPPADVDVNVTP